MDVLESETSFAEHGTNEKNEIQSLPIAKLPGACQVGEAEASRGVVGMC